MEVSEIKKKKHLNTFSNLPSSILNDTSITQNNLCCSYFPKKKKSSFFCCCQNGSNKRIFFSNKMNIINYFMYKNKHQLDKKFFGYFVVIDEWTKSNICSN